MDRTIQIHGYAPRTTNEWPAVGLSVPPWMSDFSNALAVTGKQRSPLLKDVPTMEEIGFKGFDAMQWYGVAGPAGMPQPVVRRLNESLASVLKAPDMAEKLSGEAVLPWAMSPEEFSQHIRSEVTRWTALAKARNIQLDE